MNIDALTPKYDPKQACKWLKIPSNRLNYYINLTIKTPAKLSAGRGKKSQFCAQDLILMKLGIALSGMGMNPGRIQIILAAVRENWDNFALQQYDPETQTIEGGRAHFLVAKQTRNGFFADIIPEKRIPVELGMSSYTCDGIPRLVLQIQAFTAFCLIDIVTEFG